MHPASSQVPTASPQSQSKLRSTTHTSVADPGAHDLNNPTPDNSNLTPTPGDSLNLVEKSAVADSAAKRRTRPPLSYTDDFDTPESVTMRPIGVVRSPYKVRSLYFIFLMPFLVQRYNRLPVHCNICIAADVVIRSTYESTCVISCPLIGFIARRRGLELHGSHL